MVPGVIGYIPEYRGVTGTPRGVNGPHGPKVEKRRGGQGRPRAPPPLVRIGQGGGRPPFLPPLSPFLPPLLLGQGKEGVLLPVGVGLLPGAPPPGRPPLPPCSFIYGGRGAPLDTPIDPLDLLAVCGAPLLHNPPR